MVGQYVNLHAISIVLGLLYAAMSTPIDEKVALSSRRCAGARYLYQDVAQDPLAQILAGDDIIAGERVNKENNAVYPVVAVRTRWMDERMREALVEKPGISQVVLCGAGMDARGYRMPALKHCQIYELDVASVLAHKEQELGKVSDRFPLLAQGIHRIDSDFSDDRHWISKLHSAGFRDSEKTIWILEGFLYYFPRVRSAELLRTIRQHSAPGSVLLADHINDFTLESLQNQASNKWLTNTFSSSMEDPKESLQKLGFHDVRLVTAGDEGANYGIWRLPVLPREKKDVMRTYLFDAHVR